MSGCEVDTCPPGHACALDGPRKGQCVPSEFASFRPGPPLASLPKCMRSALEASWAGKATLQEDHLMGAMGQPVLAACPDEKGPFVPYCQRDEYADTEYCACVNSGVAFPECSLAACQSGVAYMTSGQALVAADAAKRCPPQNICRQIIDAEGQNNVTQGNQTINCGTTADNAKASILSNPRTAIAIIVLVVALLVAILLSGGASTADAPAITGGAAPSSGKRPTKKVRFAPF